MGIYFEHWYLDVATVATVALATLYLYVQFIVFGHWKRRNIPFMEPSFPLGNFGDTICQRTSIGELIENVYNTSSEKIVGIFALTRPILVVRDPELVRAIFIKDFAHFTDRGVYIDEKVDPLSGHLFALSGDKWKNLRTKLSPVFTSGKLKASFESLVGCGKSLQKFVKGASDRNEVIEVREISARFSTDVIASVAFGVDINCTEEPDTPFRYYGRKV